jgi:hypothetical protein
MSKTITEDAVPSLYFQLKPYRVSSTKFENLCCVENARGFNCLSFLSQPGAKFTDEYTAQLIADYWNSRDYFTKEEIEKIRQEVCTPS